MAISRIAQVTMEYGNLGEWDYIVSGVWNGGGYGGPRIESTGYGHNTDWRKYFTASSQIRGGCFIYHGDCDGATNTHLLRFYASGITTEKLRLQFAPVNGASRINLYINGTWRDWTNFWDLKWYYLAWDIKLDSVSGWVKIYNDGVEVLSYTGNTGTGSIGALRFGPASGAIAANFDWYCLSGLYIDDTTGEASATPPPALRFNELRPDGNGNYSEWVGSDGDQTNNYLLVDETGASGADYVIRSNADKLDSYTLQSPGSAFAGRTWNALINYALALRNGSTEQIALGFRLSSTDDIGSDKSLTGSWDYDCWERKDTKPGGGSWTLTDIENAEMIIKSRGTY